MWALWPVRGFGVLAVAMNVLMIAATPVIGAHYVIDVIGGVLLAALCIIAVKYGLAFIVGRPAAANTIKTGYIPAH